MRNLTYIFQHHEPERFREPAELSRIKSHSPRYARSTMDDRLSSSLICTDGRDIKHPLISTKSAMHFEETY